MHRASCRNSAVFVLDAALSKTFRGLESRVDLFNLPNLLGNRWGLVRETAMAESELGPLRLVGWDAPLNRPRYRVPAAPSGQLIFPGRDKVVVDASRWRAQVSLRYAF
jgi:hypothetical protein